MKTRNSRSRYALAGLLTAALLGLTACAADPAAEYLTTLKSRESSSPSDIAAAVKAATPFSLTEGDRQKFEIDTGDPVVTLGGLASFYEVFRVKGTSGSPLTVTTYSLVKGRGLDLYVVWPRVFFVDPSGSVIDGVPSDGRVSVSLWGFGKDQWECNWAIATPKDGDYLVLVTSDNRVLNKTMATDTRMLAAGTIFFPWTYGYLAHTTGEMAITWK